MQAKHYYLQLLLMAIPGAISFKSLQTVQGRLYPTFKDACTTLGLVENNREHELYLAEARGWQTGSQLQLLFALILVFSVISNPSAL